ncbi:MAG: peptidoglycan DD-metalloendopeptidase family protein [Cyanobacteria bacterium J06632_22]
MRKQALRMALLGVTTLTAFQAMAAANSVSVKPESSDSDAKETPKASGESAVVPTRAVSVPVTIAPEPAAPAFDHTPSVADPGPDSRPFGSSPAVGAPVPAFARPQATQAKVEPKPAPSSPAASATPLLEPQITPGQMSPSTTTGTASSEAPANPSRATRPVDSLSGVPFEGMEQGVSRDFLDRETASAGAPQMGGSRLAVASTTVSVPIKPTREEQIPAGMVDISAGVVDVIDPETDSSGLSSLRYRLQPGDTLQSISSALQVPVEDLTAANSITETTLLIAGDDLVIPDGVPSETAQGLVLKADFAALSTPAADADAERSGADATRLSYLQSTVERPVDRVRLLEQLRPAPQPVAEASELVDGLADGPEQSVSSPMASDSSPVALSTTTTEPVQADPRSEDETPDLYASRLLAALRAPITVVETEVEPLPEGPTDVVTDTPADDERVASSATGSGVSAPAAVQVSVASRRTVTPRVPVLSPGRTVDTNEPVLPGRENYLPQPTGEVDGFIWPTRGVVSSGYGWRWGRMHRGVDIAAPTGTPIVASAPGVVEQAGWNNGGYGNLVDIRHADGSLTRYAHNSRLHVEVGQRVQQGELIAEMGSTGYSTGPHLHFEIHQPTQGTVNPMAFMPDQRLLQQ